MDIKHPTPTHSGFTKRQSKAKVSIAERPETLNKKLALGGILKGLGVTMRHFFTNVARGEKPEVTIRYPEEKVPYPDRNRGLHRLMAREDGSVRCVACQCCSTACPAHCITIVAEETGNANEKRPAIFEIDELRCVVCGLCVEACPCDAIRMDTKEHAHVTDKRYGAILGKTDLLSRAKESTAVQGGAVNWLEKQPPPADDPKTRPSLVEKATSPRVFRDRP
jgi:NADH-quinone oxidoreductase subunit I